MAGWTTPKTWAAGELTAAELNQQLRDNLLALNPPPIIKASDESINLSTTLQADNHLTYTLPGTGTFEFDLFLFAMSAANSAGDLSLGFSFPTGTCHFGGFGLDTTLTSGNTGTVNAAGILSATSGVSVLNYGLSTTTLLIRVSGILVASAAGSLTLMWAQQASNANNTTVKAGSYLRVRQGAA